MAQTIGAVLIDIKGDTQQLIKSFDQAQYKVNKSIDTMKKAVLGLAATYVSLQALENTIGAIATAGLNTNKELERLSTGLASLTAATSKNIDSLGNQLDYHQKFALAVQESSQAMDELLRINASTPHTLNQTVQIYKSMYVGMRNAGASSKDMIELTQKLSIAAGSAGIDFHAMLSAMDGLATGTVETNSEMGRFLKSIGLSNEEIKKSADVVELFNKKLDGFKAIETYDTKVSNLKNSFNLLSASITKLAFESIKENIDPLSNILDTMAKGAERYRIEWTKVQDLHKEDEIRYKQRILIEEKLAVKNDKFMYDSEQKEKLKEINKQLEILRDKLTEIKTLERKGKLKVSYDPGIVLREANKIIDEHQVKLEELNKKWLTHFKAFKKHGEDTTPIIQAWIKELESLNERYIPEKEENESIVSSSLATWKQYYIELKDYQTAWEIEKGILIDKYGVDHAQKLFGTYKKDFFDKFKDEAKTINDDINITTTFDPKSNKVNDWQQDLNNAIELYPEKQKEITDYFSKRYEEITKQNIKNEEKAKKSYLFDLQSTLSYSLSDSIVSALQNGTNIQQGISKNLVSQGGSIVSDQMAQMAMGSGNPYSMGAGLAIGAVGAMLEKPTKTLIEQKNYLEDLSSSNQTIAKQTKALEYLNELFHTNSISSTKSSFLQNKGGYYEFSRGQNERFVQYFTKLYENVDDATKRFRIKTGEETYQYQKSGFLGLGASSSTRTKNIYQDFYGNEIAALEFLSQFGTDANGKLTDQGLSNLQSTFASFESLADSLVMNGLSEEDSFIVQLDNIDLEQIKINLFQKYADSFENIGLDLFDVTYETLDQYFNDTTFKKLIESDSSLNIEELTSSVNSLNSAYETEIKLNENLKKIRLDEAIFQVEHETNLIELNEKLETVSDTIKNNFVNALESLETRISSLISSTNNTITSWGASGLEGNDEVDYYIAKFHDLQDEFKGFISQDGTISPTQLDQAEELYSQLLSVSNTLASNSTLENDSYENLISDMSTELYSNLDVLNTTDEVLKVNIIATESEYFASSLNMGEEQKAKFDEYFSDGILSADEINSLSFSDAQKQNIANAYDGRDAGIATDSSLSDVDGSISSMNEYLQVIMDDLREQQSEEEATLSSDSFVVGHDLGTQERIDFANITGTSGTELDNLYSSIIPFSIKNQTDDVAYLESQLDLGDGYFDADGTFKDFSDNDFYKTLLSLNNAGFLPDDISSAMKSVVSSAQEGLQFNIDSVEALKNDEMLAQAQINTLLASGEDISPLVEERLLYRYATDAQKEFGDTVGGFISSIPDTAVLMNGDNAKDYFNEKYNLILDHQLQMSQVEHWGSSDFNVDYVESANTSYYEQLLSDLLLSQENLTPFAMGGIVTSPTRALIGEAGYSEAVIPLKTTDIMENLEGKTNRALANSMSALQEGMQDLINITTQQANEIKKIRKNNEFTGE